jgi:hypothetical protein
LYKGGYKEDEREGYGMMYWTDGSNYKGEWKKGIQHGFGKMSFPDGRVKEGMFENNIYKGPAEGTNRPSEIGSDQESSSVGRSSMMAPVRVKSRGNSGSMGRHIKHIPDREYST